MTATVSIRRWTGSAGAPTKTDITAINTRANAEDNHSTAGTTNPVRIPTAGTNYSYWVSTRLSVDGGTFTLINNLRWYSDGANNLGTGVGMNVAKASTGANAGYRQASGTAGTTGDELNGTNHTGLDEAVASAFTFTSGSPKGLNGSASGTGDLGDFVVYQITVGTSAGPGATGTETLTWVYDEV